MKSSFKEEINQIVNEFEVPLLRYAKRILKNSEIACDIVQKVFIKYVRHEQNEKNDTIQNLKAWLSGSPITWL